MASLSVCGKWQPGFGGRRGTSGEGATVLLLLLLINVVSLAVGAVGLSPTPAGIDSEGAMDEVALFSAPEADDFLDAWWS